MATLELGDSEIVAPGVENEVGDTIGAARDVEEIGVGEVGGEAEVVAEGVDGGEREGSGAGHHEEAGEAIGGVDRGGGGGFLAVEEEGGGGEREGWEGGKARVGGRKEEGGVAAEEAEDWDCEAEGFLERREVAGREKGGGAAFNGVFEEDGGFDGGVAVDDVVKTAVFHPFETDFSEGTAGEEEEGWGGDARRRASDIHGAVCLWMFIVLAQL